MHWRELQYGLEFDSIEHRNFVISSLIQTMAFPELTDFFTAQKSKAEIVLHLPETYVKPVGLYISKYEQSFDREFAERSGQPVAPLGRGNDSLVWIDYWLQSVDKIKSDIHGYISAGVDPETINRFIWKEIRNLIMKAGADAFMMRTDRYAKKSESKWFQKILWWYRSKKLEWQYGKAKLLYGPDEKYHTILEHDPSKIIHIACGYCGLRIEDNSARPESFHHFEPVLLDVETEGVSKSMLAANSVARYAKPFQCTVCFSKLQNAHITKLGRTVVVVLL
jgi:hypothetical protein